MGMRPRRTNACWKMRFGDDRNICGIVELCMRWQAFKMLSILVTLSFCWLPVYCDRLIFHHCVCTTNGINHKRHGFGAFQTDLRIIANPEFICRDRVRSRTGDTHTKRVRASGDEEASECSCAKNIELRKFFMRLKMIRMSFVFRRMSEFSHQFNVKLKWNYDGSISLWVISNEWTQWGRISHYFILQLL